MYQYPTLKEIYETLCWKSHLSHRGETYESHPGITWFHNIKAFTLQHKKNRNPEKIYTTFLLCLD